VLGWFALWWLQNPQQLTYTTYTAGEPTGSETVSISSDPGGTLTVSSRLSESAKQTIVYESELRIDAKSLAPRSYVVRASYGAELTRLEYSFGKEGVTVVSGDLKRQAALDPEALLVDPVTAAHYVLLATRLERAPKRSVKAMSTNTLEVGRLWLEERGETNLIGPGRVVPVRKLFIRMEPQGLMAYLDKENRLVLLVNPFSHRRFALSGFEKFQAARRGSADLPEGVEETETQFKNGETALAGSITAPKRAGRAPAIVIVPGPGGVDRDGNTLELNLDVYRTIGYELSAAGYVVLRYDKRGTGRSEGNLAMVTLNDLIEDVREAVRHVRSLPSVDADRVVLIGHDEGGVIAPIVAGVDARIRALVLLAAPAEPMDAVLLEQFVLTARAQKTPEEEIQRTLKERREYFARIKASRENWMDLGEQGKVFIGWLREHFNHNPLATLKKVRCPIFVIYGERDRQISPAHARKIEEAVRGALPFEIMSFRGLDHMMMESEEGEISRYADDRTVDAGFLKYLTDVLRRTVKP
jgi:pimeloyl-ACP methyl ester carboxylesterase